MRGKIGIVLLILSAVFSARAQDDIKCFGQEANDDVRKPGVIYYEFGLSDCVPGKNLPCYKQIEKDRDVCIDAAKVRKFSCDGNKPTSKDVACPPGTRCVKNVCK